MLLSRLPVTLLLVSSTGHSAAKKSLVLALACAYKDHSHAIQTYQKLFFRASFAAE